MLCRTVFGERRFYSREKTNEQKSEEKLCLVDGRSLFLLRFHDHGWIIAYADLRIEDRARSTLTDPEDACLIALNETRCVRKVREIVSTKDTTGILD